MIGRYIIDGKNTLEPVLGLAGNCRFLQYEPVSGQQGCLVTRCPPVILDMRDFKPFCAELQGQLYEAARLPDIVPVDGRIQREGESSFSYPTRGVELFRKAFFVI